MPDGRRIFQMEDLKESSGFGETWIMARKRKGVNRICSDCKKHSPIANDCCTVRILQLDFLAQRLLVREIIENRGHKVIFYLKFHCELNFIEMFWGAAKRYTRNNGDYSLKGLEKNRS